MANPKLEKFRKSLKKMSPDNFGDRDLLSPDLAEKIGNLADKAKITIRLDEGILEAAKKEAKARGLSYQKLINDKLLAAFELTKDSNLLQPSMSELNEKINNLTKRLQKLEQLQLKKQA